MWCGVAQSMAFYSCCFWVAFGSEIPRVKWKDCCYLEFKGSSGLCHSQYARDLDFGQVMPLSDVCLSRMTTTVLGSISQTPEDESHIGCVVNTQTSRPPATEAESAGEELGNLL